MRTSTFLLVSSCLVALACYPDPRVQPRWIADLMPSLQCGMSLEQIQDLTDKEITDLGGGHRFFGTHRISTDWHGLWFRFDDGGLQAVTWGVAESSKTTRRSPRHNLCEGDLTFLLDISWTYEFAGTSVYLDGELVAEGVESPPQLELSEGPHELRIEKSGYRPIVRQLRLTSTDRGDQSIRLSSEDLDPLA